MYTIKKTVEDKEIMYKIFKDQSVLLSLALLKINIQLHIKKR